MGGAAYTEPPTHQEGDVEYEHHPIDIKKRILFVFV